MIMLDDASKEGVEEALSLLPVSSEGSGLLVTSHLIKTEKRESKTEEGLVTTHVIKVEDVFRGLLAARADGATARVAVCECGLLDDATAMQLFGMCGFKFAPEDAAFCAEVCSEIKVMSRGVPRCPLLMFLRRRWATTLLPCGCLQSGATAGC